MQGYGRGAPGSACDIYPTDAAELRSGKVPRRDVSAWRRQQIAAAAAVTGSDIAFRSDPFVGAGLATRRATTWAASTTSSSARRPARSPTS